jgi:hypothetical protein
MSTAQTTPPHPIEHAAALQREQPLLAVDTALRAFGDTRGHRSGPETDHYLDILGSAILLASGVTRERGERPFDRVFADSRADGLATAVLLRLLVLDDDVSRTNSFVAVPSPCWIGGWDPSCMGAWV